MINSFRDALSRVLIDKEVTGKPRKHIHACTDQDGKLPHATRKPQDSWHLLQWLSTKLGRPSDLREVLSSISVSVTCIQQWPAGWQHCRPSPPVAARAACSTQPTQAPPRACISPSRCRLLASHVHMLSMGCALSLLRPQTEQVQPQAAAAHSCIAHDRPLEDQM